MINVTAYRGWFEQILREVKRIEREQPQYIGYYEEIENTGIPLKEWGETLLQELEQQAKGEPCQEPG